MIFTYSGSCENEIHSEGQRNLDGHHSALDKGSCSTWSTGHFSTFDNYLYDFSGTCNYIFATVCEETSPDFNIQFRRGLNKRIERIIIQTGPNTIIVDKSGISIKDYGKIQLPYTGNGIQIAPFGHNIRLISKRKEMELAVFWNNDDYLMVLIEQKYMAKTCGLCGNFDGQELNEFLSEGTLLEPYNYANLYKIDDPAEICPFEGMMTPNIPQKKYAILCFQLLRLVSPSCNISKKGFVIRCQLDMQVCSNPGHSNCTCATLSEYSRQCSMSQQEVTKWRTNDFCSLGRCPGNQQYKECGSPCLKTCSNPEYICSSYCTYGCFCPEGTVLNDISQNHTCIPIEECPCTWKGKIFAPGDVIKTTCRTCKCTMGQWTCIEQPCPGTCSLEGGSFVTTFDSKPYRFHGVCTYILLKSSMLPHNGTLMAVYEKSGTSHTETSLAAIIYISEKEKIMISKNEVFGDENELKWLPYTSGDITIFRQSSTHIQMHTPYGLEILIQTNIVLQIYIKVERHFRGTTRGLCGNYNGETTDDFMTSMDITEGTAPLFVDSWRSGNCPPATERDTDPCSISQLNKMYAETHCSVLKMNALFQKCHSVVNPDPFVKRCQYQACNYEHTFPYICSALGSYARECALKGIPLWNWRNIIDNCTVSCTGNQTFSYNAEACDRTCLSLSSREIECHPTDVPIDGCNCPKGTYLNHKNECVQKSQCPCYLKGRQIILANQNTIIDGFTCYCSKGNLTCMGKPTNLLEICSPPKKYISCSASSGSKYGAACAPTCQMLATGTDCIPTKCESGCVCAPGLYENLDGTCVPPEECPCEYSGISYEKGAEINTGCNTCTCTRGKWKCIQNSKCSSTCSLYGEGHLTSFDGQHFAFDGNCEYILAMDGCDMAKSSHTFKIVTENVVCGNTGVTCSRAIKLYLGNLTIIMGDKTFNVYGSNPLIHFFIEQNTLHLIIQITIPGKYNMTLIWNRHMNLFIKLFRETKDHLCGLCGNYNGNVKDDFETRSKYLASNEFVFVNSWKENPLCGDVSFAADPCTKNPYRKAWAEKQCSIVNSPVFAPCHNKVYRMSYYESCVRDTCGCDSGGDCECLCDIIAVYAKACLDAGVCIDWRTPDFCPVYCDYFNTHKKIGMDYSYVNEINCTWHYRPCKCPNMLPVTEVNVEGCYNCSHEEYYDSKQKACVPCEQPPTTTPTPITATTTPLETTASSSPSTVSSTLKITSTTTIPQTSTIVSTHFTASTTRRSSTPKTTVTTSLSVTTRTTESTESAKTISYKPIITPMTIHPVRPTVPTEPSIHNQTTTTSTLTSQFTNSHANQTLIHGLLGPVTSYSEGSPILLAKPNNKQQNTVSNQDIQHQDKQQWRQRTSLSCTLSDFT
ncbi:mucin-6 [Protobothrops mucrosquamatus]|uniref:mucin-6 n=1 Tax=Protobothrops mucrosquamatus TaxID=103944 RepID=UPI0007757644|nr:mucin-6 [Protobothrops mucrosquamatus]